jgi:hypothetical protein
MERERERERDMAHHHAGTIDIKNKERRGVVSRQSPFIEEGRWQ